MIRKTLPSGPSSLPSVRLLFWGQGSIDAEIRQSDTENYQRVGIRGKIIISHTTKMQRARKHRINAQAGVEGGKLQLFVGVETIQVGVPLRIRIRIFGLRWTRKTDSFGRAEREEE